MKHKKLSIAFDMDGVLLDTTPAIIQLHHEVTGEIPKLHHSQTKMWNFEDIITATNDQINGYFISERLFEIITFISDDKMSMKTLIEELLSSELFEVYCITKGVPDNIELKKVWLKERLPLFNIDNLIGVPMDVDGKPDVKTTVFIDDFSKNFNGNAKYNILFRKNGLVTDYNTDESTSDYQTGSVSELASKIFELLDFERMCCS